MRILTVSDLHLQPLSAVERVVRRLRPDVMLYAGDGCARFGAIPADVLIDAAAGILRQSGLQSGFVRSKTARNGRALVLGADGACRICPPGRAWRVQLGFNGDAPDLTVHAKPASATDDPGTVRLVHEHNLAFHVPPRAVPRGGDWRELGQHLPLGIAAVLGNDAHPLDAAGLEAAGVHDLDLSPLDLGPATVIGLGGSPSDGEIEVSDGYLYREEDARSHLSAQVEQLDDRPTILVGHAPPFGVLDLARHGEFHRAGSAAVIEAAADPRLQLIICGHVHRCGGRRDQLGQARVVNIASEATLGAPLRYALITLDDRNGRVLAVDLGEEHVGDPLRQIVHIGAHNAHRLRRSGFDSVEDVANGRQPHLKKAVGPKRAVQVQAHAQSLLHQRPVAMRNCSPPGVKLIFLDVETDVETLDIPWMIGVLDPHRDRLEQLVELDEAGMAAQLRRLGRLISRHPSAYIATWGHFDRCALEKAHRRFGLRIPHWLDRRRWWDFHHWLGERVAFPYTDTKLSTISRHFGFERRHVDVSGGTVGAMYTVWRAGRREDLDLALAKEHNADDLLALRAVVDGLRTSTANLQPLAIAA